MGDRRTAAHPSAERRPSPDRRSHLRPRPAEYVGALAWVNQAEAAKVCGSESLDDPRLRDHLARSLAELAAGEGSSLRVERLLLLTEPPSLDAGEITDKGYLNQRACLRCRADDVARLYRGHPDPATITPS